MFVAKCIEEYDESIFNLQAGLRSYDSVEDRSRWIRLDPQLISVKSPQWYHVHEWSWARKLYAFNMSVHCSLCLLPCSWFQVLSAISCLTRSWRGLKYVFLRLFIFDHVSRQADETSLLHLWLLTVFATISFCMAICRLPSSRCGSAWDYHDMTWYYPISLQSSNELYVSYWFGEDGHASRFTLHAMLSGWFYKTWHSCEIRSYDLRNHHMIMCNFTSF